ncbi:MAG: 4Fe-4S dicluster domain-containing protein [Halovenus sp.]
MYRLSVLYHRLPVRRTLLRFRRELRRRSRRGRRTDSPEYGVDRGTREDGKSPIGNVRKCSFCTHRLERGEEPACVETCIGDARNMGDLDDPDSEVAQMADSSRAFQLKEAEGTDPNVYYLK